MKGGETSERRVEEKKTPSTGMDTALWIRLGRIYLQVGGEVWRTLRCKKVKGDHRETNVTESTISSVDNWSLYHIVTAQSFTLLLCHLATQLHTVVCSKQTAA